MRKELAEIIPLLSRMLDVDIALYDSVFLQKTIEARMSANGITGIKEYCSCLSQNNSEQELLFQSLQISYSEFFRNQLTFSLLDQQILPGLINARLNNGQKEIRIWSAGCAAGQEAYSVAILLDGLIAEHSDQVTFRIFATDRSCSELEAAQKGIYDVAAVRNVRLKHIKKYFIESDDSYALEDGLKKRVNFSLFDLLDESSNSPPSSIYGDFDIVFCSNLLFYYQPEIRQAILDKVYRSLSAEGYLITGEAEKAIVEKHGGFFSYAKPSAIFKKIYRGNR